MGMFLLESPSILVCSKQDLPESVVVGHYELPFLLFPSLSVSLIISPSQDHLLHLIRLFFLYLRRFIHSCPTLRAYFPLACLLCFAVAAYAGGQNEISFYGSFIPCCIVNPICMDFFLNLRLIIIFKHVNFVTPLSVVFIPFLVLAIISVV